MSMSSNLEHSLVLGGQNGLYRVETERGTLSCRSATKIRKDGCKLMAGDRVTVEDNEDGTGFVRAVEPRVNSLVRPPVANVGLLVIVAAADHPKPLPFNIDKLTVIAEKEKIPVAIVVSKSELGDSEHLSEIYADTPYPVFRVSDYGSDGTAGLLEAMSGKTTVFCGASGVGKSTLLNKLFPFLNAEVGELSEKIARGKNTTRTTSLFRVAEQTYVADTPGFTMLETGMYCKIDKKELISLFPEMEPYAATCRYSHCTHLCEDGCGVVGAVAEGKIRKERHESFKRLYEELKAFDPYK